MTCLILETPMLYKGEPARLFESDFGFGTFRIGMVGPFNKGDVAIAFTRAAKLSSVEATFTFPSIT
jgi:hypothetical protein